MTQGCPTKLGNVCRELQGICKYGKSQAQRGSVLTAAPVTLHAT